MQRIKKGSARTWLSLIALVAVCVLLNNLGSRLNGLAGLPLYIDNIGTILAALLGGYIPCITVGFFSNLLNAFSNPVSIYYCVISVFIATAAALFAEKLRRLRIPHILLAVFTFALIGGSVGGLLTWLINGLSFGEGAAVDMAAAIDRAVPVGYFPSNLISCFIVDIADKAIVTAIALIIYKLLPKKLVGHLREFEWYYINVVDTKERKLRKRA